METEKIVEIKIKCCAECLFRTFIQNSAYCILSKRYIYMHFYSAPPLFVRPPICPLNENTIKIEGI